MDPNVKKSLLKPQHKFSSVFNHFDPIRFRWFYLYYYVQVVKESCHRCAHMFCKSFVEPSLYMKALIISQTRACVCDNGSHTAVVVHRRKRCLFCKTFEGLCSERARKGGAIIPKQNGYINRTKNRN